VTKVTPYAFVLAVQDLEKSAVYFRDVLGFRLAGKRRPAGDWPSAMACA